MQMVNIVMLVGSFLVTALGIVHYRASASRHDRILTGGFAWVGFTLLMASVIRLAGFLDEIESWFTFAPPFFIAVGLYLYRSSIKQKGI